ncbi:uncharacterized protein LOC135484315 [Lineus longissimus]|uniref:uncharacterized protein LOC135484315 n=1 Tax=Lineus longissimus TaxID=88925 RepID=UPI00315D1E4A
MAFSMVPQRDLKVLKKKRSTAKGLLTRKGNEIQTLLDCVDSYGQLSRINDLGEELGRLFTNFLACHNAYHSLLYSPEDIAESRLYVDRVARFMGQRLEEISSWSEALKDRISEGGVSSVGSDVSSFDTSVSPDDSISTMASEHRSVKSRSSTRSGSHRSNVSMAQMRAAANCAVYEVEASLLAERQALAKKELEMVQQREELELKAKLAHARAKERACSMVHSSRTSPTNEKVGVSGNESQDKPKRDPGQVGLIPDPRLNPRQPAFHPGQVHGNISNYQSTPTPMAPESVTTNFLRPTPFQGNNEVSTCIQATEVPVSHVSALPDALMEVLHQGQQQQRLLLNTLQLPKVDLMTFDGDPLRYWLFIRAFENSVDRDLIDDSVKLSRLLRYCTGKARQVIECCAVKDPTEGYKLARKLLKDRFGSDFVVSQAWVNRIVNRKQAKGPEAIRDLADDLKNCVETLTAMKQLDRLNDSYLVQIVERLPQYLQNRWKRVVQKIRKTKDDRPSQGNPGIKDLLQLISEAAEEENDPVFGKCGAKESKTESNHKSNNKQRPGHGSAFSIQTDTGYQGSSGDKPRVPKCLVCKEAHHVTACEIFKKMTQNERWVTVRDNKVCKNCLKGPHFASNCRNPPACKVSGCGNKHNTLLHLDGAPAPKSRADGHDVQEKKADVKPQPARSNATVLSTGAGINRIASPIIPVKVKGIGGNEEVITYAMLDNCSTATLCTESLATKLGLKGKTAITELTTIERKDSRFETTIYGLEVADLDGKEVITLPHVFSKSNLNVRPNDIKPSDLNDLPHLQGLDILTVDTDKVDLLIGQDVPEALVPLEVKSHDDDPRRVPYAVRTALGWTLNGPFGENGRTDERHSCHFINNDTSLQQQVERFWKLDNLGDGTGLSMDDRKVVDLWDRTAVLQDGHYTLPIPFKQRPPNLPDNYSMAKKRLESLGRRFQKDATLHERYNTEFKTLLEEGYAELVPDEEISRKDGMVWYLPHHPVLNPKKPEKTRIVFDCAAKHRGTSLNENVLQGPDLTNKLIGVLLRFRQEKVGFTSDVRAMFNQVRVEKDHRDVLRFLYFDEGDITKAPRIYRMRTHIFGGVWSPSAANYALKKTAADNASDFPPETAETVNRSMYVDDVLGSKVNDPEAIVLATSLREMLKRGGMDVIKWASNSRVLLKAIPNSDLAMGMKDLDLDSDGLPTERALGMVWDVEQDTFRPCITTQDRPMTRRGVLSILSSVYDPLGLVSPFVLKARTIFQDLCREKLGWDDGMSQHQQQQWNRWLEDLPKLENFSVPRCLRSEDQDTVVHNQLHHFSDASEGGFGATSYLRQEDIYGRVHCALVMTKAKLTPLKTTTIPRLELTAAVEAVKLDKLLRSELEIPLCESVFWTDSMIVLYYIRNKTKRYQTFVANRVAKIHESTVPTQWRHVPTDQNPADDVSRGMTADELIGSGNDRWRNGPEFLKQQETQWPKEPIVIETEGMIEVKPEVKVYATNPTQDGGQQAISTMINHYSCWYRLKKGIAWMLRLKKVLHQKVKNKDIPGQVAMTPPRRGLTVDELLEAEQEVLKFVQKKAFGDIQANFKTCKLKKLNPVLDSDGILRVGGRLENSNLPDETKHQIILPKKHHVVDLIVRYSHNLTGHSGSERILTEVRQKFWIIKGRLAVRRNNTKCLHCRKRNVKPMIQQMADLPSDRVASPRAAFCHVGLDYFGPFQVKRGRSMVKRYGCIFTCLTTRAIHIEVAENLTTDSFINALQRFVSRRGMPIRIRSDNGTNFVGAQKELKKAIREWNLSRIEEYMRQREITWVFNPPAASHMGGVWERQIRSVRKVLDGIIKQQNLTDDTLHTMMCLVEAIINGRPLTKLSDDPDDLQPITPNHLLLLRPGTCQPPGLFDEADLYRRKWKQVQYLADLFWRRWTKEYLTALQERQKWCHASQNLKPDDLVLIVDDNAHRNSWLLGRVIETYPGKDNLVRSAKIKTHHNELTRPVTKLCLLESSVDI